MLLKVKSKKSKGKKGDLTLIGGPRPTLPKLLSLDLNLGTPYLFPEQRCAVLGTPYGVHTLLDFVVKNLF